MRALVLTAMFMVCASMAAAQAPQKPRFEGNWVLSLEKSELKAAKLTGSTILIEQPTVGEISLKETRKTPEGDKVCSFKCNTVGKDCEFTHEGTKSTISIFYNGPTLTGIERIGPNSDVVEKWLMTLSEDGTTLTLELAQLVPPRTEKDKLVFVKEK